MSSSPPVVCAKFSNNKTLELEVSELRFTSSQTNQKVTVSFLHMSINELAELILRLNEFIESHGKEIPSILSELLRNIILHTDDVEVAKSVKEDYWMNVQYLDEIVCDFQAFHNFIIHDVSGLHYTEDIERLHDSVYPRVYDCMLDELKSKPCIDFDNRILDCPEASRLLGKLLPNLTSHLFIGQHFSLTTQYLKFLLNNSSQECNSEIICFCDDREENLKTELLILYLYKWDYAQNDESQNE